MPLCCQTTSFGPSLLNILSLPGIFCTAAELFGCALPLSFSSHEWRCPKFTCDFVYSVTWRPRPFFRPVWQYLCLGWCHIFSPLKLCAVSSSTDLYIKKETTLVGFCLVAASLDPPLEWKYLWIYIGEYPSSCMPPPTRGAAWHDTIWSWNHARFVCYHEELSYPMELAASIQLPSILKMSACWSKTLATSQPPHSVNNQKRH